MRKPKVEPKNVESPFHPNEIFFSSTDLKGIILTGNDVFVNVSKYSRDELIGKPHNIIRHPDMPRIVFKLLWDYIQSGETIVAYVKNLAKDGSYYWVLASVFPVKNESGDIIRYLSIRIKPTTEIFNLIPELYREVLQVEEEGGMEAAYKYLLERIKELGFENYDDFMMTAFIKEFKEKMPYLKIENNKIKVGEFIDVIEKLESIIKQFYEAEKISTLFEDFRNILLEKSKSISSFTEDIRIISLNASVESLKLGSFGSVFSVLSQEMRKNAEISAKHIVKINRLINQSTKTIRTILFNLFLSNLQIYMLEDFLSKCEDCTSEEFYMDIENFYYLFNTSSQNLDKNQELLQYLHRDLENVLSTIEKIFTIIEELEFLHINGKIESAHLNELKFGIIFKQVKELVDKSQSSLVEIKKPTENSLKHIKLFEKNIDELIKDIKAASFMMKKFLVPV